MKNRKPALIIAILKKNVFSVTKRTKRTSKTVHVAKIAKVLKITFEAIFNILFQLDAHAKSSTAQSWMTMQRLARNQIRTKIIKNVPRSKKRNLINVLTLVTVRLVPKNAQQSIIWL